jgi:chromosome segregation ATPase
MPKGANPDYHTLIKALEDRFAPPCQTELYRVQMRERRQRAGESLPELGQAIRRLANLACPTATAEIRETLSKDQFVDALFDSEMRIKQARPRNLNDAIQLAVELEAYNKAEKRNNERSTTIEHMDGRTALVLEDICTKLESLQNEMRELKPQRKESSPQARQRDSNQTLGRRSYAIFVGNQDICARTVELTRRKEW